MEARPGSRKNGYLEVGCTPTSKIKLPFTIVHGSKKGLVLALTAGIHGCEYSGIEAAIRITNMVNPQKLTGTILSIPLVNPPAFESRTAYVCPIDGVNINRIFPGDPDGSISYRIADAVFQNVISQANYLIDLHGADIPEELPPSGLILLRPIGDKRVDKESEKLAHLLDSEYILMTELDGTCIGEAGKTGVPSVGFEAGGKAGIIDEESVEFYVNGVLNVMKFLKMISGSPIKTITPKKRITKLHRVRSKTCGIFCPNIRAGEMISKGDIIGQVKNLRGKKVEDIIACSEGVILIRITNVTINSGDLIMIIGKS